MDNKSHNSENRCSWNFPKLLDLLKPPYGELWPKNTFFRTLQPSHTKKNTTKKYKICVQPYVVWWNWLLLSQNHFRFHDDMTFFQNWNSNRCLMCVYSMFSKWKYGHHPTPYLNHFQITNVPKSALCNSARVNLYQKMLRYKLGKRSKIVENILFSFLKNCIVLDPKWICLEWSKH